MKIASKIGVNHTKDEWFAVMHCVWSMPEKQSGQRNDETFEPRYQMSVWEWRSVELYRCNTSMCEWKNIRERVKKKWGKITTRTKKSNIQCGSTTTQNQ